MHMKAINLKLLPTLTIEQMQELRTQAILQLTARNRTGEVAEMITALAPHFEQHDPCALYLVGLAMVELGAEIMGKMRADEAAKDRAPLN